MTHRLNDLLDERLSPKVAGPQDIVIEALAFDSRRVRPGSAFVAVRGTQTDGHAFIDKAIAAGAQVIVAETPAPDSLPQGLTWVQVSDSRKALAWMASAWYGHPSRELTLVGVTGTNGKTSVTTMLWQLFTALGYKVGLIGTAGIKIADEDVPATHTTPDPVQLNALLADMAATGCRYVFMEVSSHAVDQDRVYGLEFAGGVFTNITHDHLDYHKTFRNYILAKKKFFDNLPKGAFALVNLDDRNAAVMVQNTKARVYGYALKKPAPFKARVVESTPEGMQLMLNGHELHVALTGLFNACNLLAVYGVAMLLGQDELEVLQALSSLRGAPGRFEKVQVAGVPFVAIVDYAHTPDALAKVIQAARQISPSGRVITVAGAGGDRDRAKRPRMGAIAARFSQQVILTSDNPRSEPPEAIIEEMAAGMDEADRKKVLAVVDRREAIRTACRLAQPGDVVLVAGKGHETYQEIKGVKYPFDDKAEVAKAMKELL